MPAVEDLDDGTEPLPDDWLENPGYPIREPPPRFLWNAGDTAYFVHCTGTDLVTLKTSEIVDVTDPLRVVCGDGTVLVQDARSPSSWIPDADDRRVLPVEVWNRPVPPPF